MDQLGFMMSYQNNFSVQSDPYLIIMVHAMVVGYTDTEDHKVVCSQKCIVHMFKHVSPCIIIYIF
jgi:hypothetical protein